MLLKQAEIEIDKDFTLNRKLAVYVNFKTSTLLEGVKANQKDAFQIWVGAKILQALHEKLIFLDLVGHEGNVDPYEQIFGIKSTTSIRSFLREKTHLLQKLANAEDKEETIGKLGSDFLDKVNDISFLLEIVNDIIERGFKFQVQQV